MKLAGKDRLWTLALVAIAVALIAAGLQGIWSASKPTPLTAPAGLWRNAPENAPSELQREQIARLEALGYVAGSEPPSGQEKVIAHDPELAYRGLNLHTSGHAPEALLTDMEGRVLHRWSYAFADAFPEHPGPEGPALRSTAYWRRVHLFENGDLLAIYDGTGLIKLDAQSNLLFAIAGEFHHDLFVDPDGTIYVLVHEAELVPRIDPKVPMLLDFIEVLDATGRRLRRVPILEAIERSRYAELLDRPPANGDIFHTNTLEVFDGSQASVSPIFRRGNALISMRSLHTIAIVDLKRGLLVWASTGPWLMQHQPTLLPNGNMLLFDNIGHHGMSKVIEFDPLTLQIVWRYDGTAENGFSSETFGSNQRLPNGNTLITESDSGRAFEVTRAGQVVWEYHNMARAGPNEEFVASLCEMIRLPPDFHTKWARAPGS